MAYQQLSLRMIRLLVSLEKGEVLQYRSDTHYYWLVRAGSGVPEPPHWGTVLALVKRDLLSAKPLNYKQILGGSRLEKQDRAEHVQRQEYHLTDKARMYLQERSLQHDRDHA